MESHILRPGSNDAGKRIDRILRSCFPGVPLAALFAALRRGDIRVGGRKVRQDYRVAEGDAISVKMLPGFSPRLEAGRAAAPGPGAREAAGFRFQVVFEDTNFFAVNKPWGILSQGAASLDGHVKAWLAPRLPRSLAFSPAPLHRLDRNTSGLVFFSKSIEGARAFTWALRGGKITKTYYALLEGRLAAAQTWEDSLVRDTKNRVTKGAAPGAKAGKTALTEVRPLAVSASASCTLCEIRIRSGRTHQIRSQAALHGHPLAGDRKYGGRPLAGAPHGGAYILHAARLSFPPLEAEAPLPQDAAAFLKKLFPAVEYRR
ncbi:MAG: RluA family pseudouridine synthase [Spirochaetia bacterium]|jgi:23S rRNA pseudouridine955/2504/2580 synthase|nr:RluA family pseudouridine synthase [Spirochaetia bacterium]